MSATADTRDKLARRRPVWVWSVLIIILVSVAGGLGWFVMTSSPPDEIVVLRSDDEPFRVRPVDRGGKQVNHQNSRALLLLDNMDPDGNAVETLALPDPDPELPPVEVPPVEVSDANEQILSSAKEQDNASMSEELNAQSTSMNDKDETDNSASIEASNIVAQPKARPQRTEAKTSKTAKPDPEAPFFTIQLAAFQSQDKAENAAALLNEKHVSRLKGVSLGVTRSENTQGAVFWRVTSEAIEKAEADTICTLLRSAGQDCIVKKAAPLS